MIKNQILITFTEINIRHSVKSFDISFLTAKIIMGQTTRYTEQAHAKSSKLNFISLSFCIFLLVMFAVIILDCHVTHPTVTQKHCVTPHNDACERDHPTRFTIINTHKSPNKHFQVVMSYEATFSRSRRPGKFQGLRPQRALALTHQRAQNRTCEGPS